LIARRGAEYQICGLDGSTATAKSGDKNKVTTEEQSCCDNCVSLADISFVASFGKKCFRSSHQPKTVKQSKPQLFSGFCISTPRVIIAGNSA
jgi:hypothetical protein